MSVFLYRTVDGTVFQKYVHEVDAIGSYYPYENGRCIYIDYLDYLVNGFDVTEDEFFSMLIPKLVNSETDRIVGKFRKFPEREKGNGQCAVTVVERPEWMYKKQYSYIDMQRARRGR